MANAIGMTDIEAAADHAAHPHLDIETIAYYDGRNSVDYGYGCGFTDQALVAAWKRGRRQVLAEDRLNADTEWD